MTRLGAKLVSWNVNRLDREHSAFDWLVGAQIQTNVYFY